jgi:hypothetical protein
MKALIFILFAFVVTVTAEAQTSFKSPYDLASDTVTNAGTAYLQVRNGGAATGLLVQVVVTKISGTVGGTITLQGSLDGTSNWKALNTVNTQTALPTITATDASNNYHWWLSGNPFPYYRVSWTGTGTMAASFTAKVLSR